MRTFRFRRVVVLISAALGLVAPALPPAQAATASHLTFRGTLLADGLSYPCVGSGTPALAKCPTLAVGPGAPPGKTLTIQGSNTRSFTFTTSMCVTAAVTDVPHPAVKAGTCMIEASGVLTGSCGLWSGLGTYTQKEDSEFVLLQAPSIGTLLTIRRGTFHFVNGGAGMVIVGNVASGGTLGGAVGVTPFGTIQATRSDHSCSSKSSYEFTVDGEVTILEP